MGCGAGTFRAGLLSLAVLGAQSSWGEGGRAAELRGGRIRAQHSEISQVAKQAMSAVVSITTREKALGDTDPQPPASASSAPSSPEEPHKGLGSGFIIHPDGYILTCSHVIEGTSEITVTMLDAAGRPHEYQAVVAGQDAKIDVALLKIHAEHKLPVLRLGSSRSVDVADWVVVIGNPFGLTHSVSVGVVSFKGRADVTPAGRTGFFDFIQTDASINPGNSGGPVLAINGEVVAISNAVNVAGQGIGFAVPIDMVKQVLPQLYATGSVKRAWLGLSVQDLTPEEARKAGATSLSGVLVSDVVGGSPAERGGLRAGDIILGLGHRRVERAHTLRWRVANAGIGRPLELRVSRQGKPLRLRVRLEAIPPGGDEFEGEAAAKTTSAIHDSSPPKPSP